MRRILFVVLAVVALAALGLYAFRGPIALRVVRAGLERNFRADPIAALPDGLHLRLCGAGGPLPDPVRSGPCVAIVAGERLFVVDAGSGGARNLARMGWAPGRVEAVFLTHFHSDHIDGLGELSLQRWAGGSHAERLPVFGPPGVQEVVAGFDRAYAQDAAYRVAHHGPTVVPPEGAGMEARTFPVPPGTERTLVWSQDGLRVSAFQVDHAPVRPAVGYRFDYGGRSILVSGDTRSTESVERNARGVDLLVHEALSARLVRVAREAALAGGRDNLAKILHDIPEYHTTPVQAARIARAAGVGHLLLYHIVPPLPVPGLEAVFLDGVADVYDGDVILGRDGTAVDLPSGSDAVEVER
jgi:ribonuclease Z